MSQESVYLQSLVRELIALPAETEWLELKHNNGDLQQIGEYLSALSNAAAACGKAFAYLLWGIDNESHAVLGTTFEPHAAKIGNEELESWLLRQLAPKIDFRFHSVDMDVGRVVLLQIGRAFRHPVQFAGQEYIRIGTYKKKLKEFPEKERALWRIFDETPFEDMPALEKATVEDVLRLLDYPAYFDLLGQPLPENRDGILRALAADELIEPVDGGRWNIRNLGAILFAKRLADFSTLKRKAVRVITYKGTGHTRSILFTPRTLSKMDQSDRVRAVYLHACLRYVQRDFMTNTSLRERFAIDPKNSAVASRLIKEALNAKVIRPYDGDASRKFTKYVPAWV